MAKILRWDSRQRLEVSKRQFADGHRHSHENVVFLKRPGTALVPAAPASPDKRPEAVESTDTSLLAPVLFTQG